MITIINHIHSPIHTKHTHIAIDEKKNHRIYSHNRLNNRKFHLQTKNNEEYTDESLQLRNT